MCEFWHTTGSAAKGDPYATYKAAVGASFGRTQAGLVGRFGSTSEDIAKVITQAITARRPRARYLINPVAKSLVAMNQVLAARGAPWLHGGGTAPWLPPTRVGGSRWRARRREPPLSGPHGLVVLAPPGTRACGPGRRCRPLAGRAPGRHHGVQGLAHSAGRR